MNVFGSPITGTKYELAKLANSKINDDNKSVNAQAYLNGLAANSDGVATKCLIYNATGETMTLVMTHDYEGRVGDSMPPTKIKNGQWGAFFYETENRSASEGAVVYGLESVQCMLSWCNTDTRESHCYAEIHKTGHFMDPAVWNVIHNKMKKVEPTSFTQDFTEDGTPYQVSSNIGVNRVCEYKAVVKRRG